LHGRPFAFAHQPQLIIAALVDDQDHALRRGRPAEGPSMAGAKAGEALCHHC
jgi:hypothetical protein